MNKATPRMKECLELVQRGLTNKDIGAAMYITEGAVDALVVKLLALYEVKSRFELIVKTRREQGAHKSRTKPVYYVFDAPNGLVINHFNDFDYYFRAGEIACFSVSDKPVAHKGQHVYVLLLNDEMRMVDNESVTVL